MSQGPRRFRLPPVIRPPGPFAGVADADLLARWVAGRDEAAFELLVRRHGPAVLAACRRVLADPNDADDAFQAAFLVLARKAASVARGEVLAAWLHRVAYRAALRVRTGRAARTGRQESVVVDQLPAAPPADPAWAELLRVLDEEVERLPARHRAVFVLCCLEGKTGEEAGRLLGCPPGTVSSRLTRARERLRDRLTRRGFAPAALLLTALTGDALAVSVPNALVESVVGAAPVFFNSHPGGGLPGRPAAIAEGVMRAMFAQKLKLLPILFAVGVLAAGAVLARPGPGPDGDPGRTPPAPPGAAGVSAGKVAGQERATTPVVRLVKPQPGGMDRVSTLRSVAEAAKEVHLLPVVAGVLKQVNVNIGDRVKQGQLLAEIDAPVLILDVRQAEAGVLQSKGLAKEAEARAAAARAEVDAAKAVLRSRTVEADAAKKTVDFRKKQFDRVKDLVDRGAQDVRLRDEAQDQFLAAEAQAAAAAAGVDNARADLAVRLARLDAATAGVVTAQANVEAAKVGLEKARLAAEQTRVTAPFDGVVTVRGGQPGEFVRPGERADPTPLFTVMRADVIRLVVAVPERDAARVSPGVPAEVTFDARPNVTTAGTVARTGFALDPKTRTMRAEIDLPNPEGEIRPGLTGDVRITLGKGSADALRVPRSAVYRFAEGPVGGQLERKTAVYVYRDGKAIRTLVRLGIENAREAEILSGLAPGDLVVADAEKITKTTKLGQRAEVPVEVEQPQPPK